MRFIPNNEGIIIISRWVWEGFQLAAFRIDFGGLWIVYFVAIK